MRPAHEPPLYFGYGSNLDAQDLAAFCARRGVQARLRPVGRAWLPDRVLRFETRSHSRQGGCLDVVPALGQLAAGVLFEADQESWRTLDLKEGAPRWYRPVDTVALTEDGEPVAVRTYEATDLCRVPHADPAPGYLEVVLRGRAAHGVQDEGQLLAAARGLEPPPAVAGLFLYGTLRPGGARFDLVQPHLAGPPRPAWAQGDLLDCGAWPGMVPGSGRVHGVLAPVRDLARALPALDEYEGFAGWSSAPGLFQRSLFQRTVLTVTPQEDSGGDGAPVRAWGWRLVADRPGRLVPGGDWLVHLRDR